MRVSVWDHGNGCMIRNLATRILSSLQKLFRCEHQAGSATTIPAMMGMSTVLMWSIPNLGWFARLTGHQDASTPVITSRMLRMCADYPITFLLKQCCWWRLGNCPQAASSPADQEKLTHVKEVFMEKENALTSKAETREPRSNSQLIYPLVITSSLRTGSHGPCIDGVPCHTFERDDFPWLGEITRGYQDPNASNIGFDP
jgi:hypothetical protein